MPVRIVRKEEKNQIQIDGSTFSYRRVPSDLIGQYVKRHTPRKGGEPDWQKVGLEMLNYALLDWGNVEDLDGSKVEFDKELIPALPQVTQAELIEELGGSQAQLHEEVKN
jgi:hypothetical protein